MDSYALIAYLDSYLTLADYDDYGPQGLQVEAERASIKRVALAVDVAPPIIHAAADWSADLLLVHHGILWRNVTPIAGPLGARVRALLSHRIHLYAAHLALDAHPEVGNNAVLARALGVSVTDRWCAPMGVPIGVLGVAPAGMTRVDLCERLTPILGQAPRLLPYGPEQPSRIAILTGAGADQVAEACALGADTLVTGETAHQEYWAASDFGLNVLFGGHYATETVGVKALGDHLADRFGLETTFLDFPTGM